MTDGSDEELIARIMQGDTGALAPLVERHHAGLLGYLYRLTHGQRQLAEDLVQDTFIRILQQSSFQPGRPFRPWLYATATHLAFDHLRRSAARPTTSLDPAVAADLGDDRPGPAEHAEAAVVGQLVATAVGQLAPEFRATIILRFYQGFHLQEIADTLGVPLGTVKVSPLSRDPSLAGPSGGTPRRNGSMSHFDSRWPLDHPQHLTDALQEAGLSDADVEDLTANSRTWPRGRPRPPATPRRAD